MSIPSPFTALAVALDQACSRDLPPVTITRRHPVASRAKRELAAHPNAGPAGLSALERAVPQECEVVLFLQRWPACALGYGEGLAAPETVAYTVLVRWRRSGVRAVYFGASGRLAYLIPPGSHVDQLQQYVGRQTMPDVEAAAALGWTARL